MAFRASAAEFAGEERRFADRRDRRAAARGGRRRGDARKPWWMRRRVWLTVGTFAWMVWRKVRQNRLSQRIADTLPH